MDGIWEECKDKSKIISKKHGKATSAENAPMTVSLEYKRKPSVNFAGDEDKSVLSILDNLWANPVFRSAPGERKRTREEDDDDEELGQKEQHGRLKIKTNVLRRRPASEVFSFSSASEFASKSSDQTAIDSVSTAESDMTTKGQELVPLEQSVPIGPDRDEEIAATRAVLSLATIALAKPFRKLLSSEISEIVEQLQGRQTEKLNAVYMEGFVFGDREFDGMKIVVQLSDKSFTCQSLLLFLKDFQDAESNVPQSIDMMVQLAIDSGLPLVVEECHEYKFEKILQTESATGLYLEVLQKVFDLKDTLLYDG